jgi:hypothetical protein
VTGERGARQNPFVILILDGVIARWALPRHTIYIGPDFFDCKRLLSFALDLS